MTKTEQNEFKCNHCGHSAHCGHSCMDETCDHCTECGCIQCEIEQEVEHNCGYN